MKLSRTPHLSRLRRQQLYRLLEPATLFAGFYLVTFSVLLLEGALLHRAAVYAVFAAAAKYATQATHGYCWGKIARS